MFRCSKKRSRETWEDQEEEAMENSSASSSSSSAAPAAKHMRITASLPTSLCNINEDVLRLLMKFVLVNDLKNILFVNKFLKGIVGSYLLQLLNQPSFSTTDDFSNLNRAFEVLEVVSKLPNYDPNKKTVLKLKRGVHEVVGSLIDSYDSMYQQMLSVFCNNLSIVSECPEMTTMFGGLTMQGNHLGTMTFLVGVEGIDVSQARNDGGKALFDASKNGYLDVVKLLIGLEEINVNQAAENNGATALIMASRNGHLDVVKLLIGMEEINVNQTVNGGATALYIASQNGHSDVVKLLIGMEEINVNQTANGGCTALFIASQKGRLDVVKLLIGVQGIKVNQAATNGATALIMASRNGHLNIVKLLIGMEEINVNQTTNNGGTALYIASYYGHSDIVKLLLGAEAININQARNGGCTALFIASQNGHSGVVKLLLGANGIHVNQPMTNGATPLIIASYLGHASCVSLLLADPAINPALLYQERTALQLAQSSARVEGWEILEDQINMEGRATVVQLLVLMLALSSRN